MTDCSPQRAEAFSRKLTDILNHGALNLALGLGRRLGLLDALAGLDRPVAAGDLASRAGLNVRYVREWLGVLMAGGVVDLTTGEDGAELYRLPPEHAGLLTGTGNGPDMGVYTQEITLLTALAYDAVAEGFLTGRGVPYSKYPRFQAFMTELSEAKHHDLLVGGFLPSVDKGLLVDRLERGIRVMDLGCGEGAAVILMAEAYPDSSFVGVDLSAEAVAEGRRRAEERGLGNLEFLVRDAAGLGLNDRLASSFDYVTAFDSIHDQTAPAEALSAVYRILAPGGLFSLVDIAAETGHAGNRDHPMGPFLYAVSLMHCLPVGLHNNGAGLGMMWGRRKAVEMMKEAGFSRVETLEMEYDPFNYHFLGRKE